MPATEPNIALANLGNYPPSVGQALADLLLRAPFWLCLPITFNNADASVLYTVPTGQRMHILQSGYEVSVAWTGGAASTIGVSSSSLDYNSKGDILGGAAGDVAATLVATLDGTSKILKGTAGTKFTVSGAVQRMITIAAGFTIRHDRITSAYTAGAGNVHLLVAFVPAA